MIVSNATTPLEYTGERMVPERADRRTFWEHIYRYRFACGLVRGRRILDIACGEGYGAYALSKAGAASVIGVDICEQTCCHARQKYGLDVRCGNAQAIPLADNSVDVVVSFETIEHLPRVDLFLMECARVLTTRGLLVISTPNQPVYSAASPNEFHCSEMDQTELTACLAVHFDLRGLYGQSSVAANWWSVRSWAARNSGWNRVRGVWRVKSLLCPHLFQHRGASYRQRPVEAILRRDNPLSTWVNPFLVRPWSRWAGEQPSYFLAVAQKRPV